MSDTTNPGSKSAHEIEREVDQTRDNLTATIDALQERFSVETLIDRAMQSVTQNGGEVSRNLGRTVRDNPVPFILTGIGLAWMMASGNRGPAPGPSVNRDAPEPPVTPVHPQPVRPAPYSASTDMPVRSPSLTPAPGDTTSGPSLKDRAHDAMDSVSEAAGHAKDRVAHRAASLQDAAGARYDSARQNMAQTGSDLSHKIEKFVTEQPLVVAALGFAAGAGLGAMFRSTRLENRLVGDYADQAKAAASEFAEEQVETAKAVASEVASEAKQMVNEATDALDQKTPNGTDFVEKVKDEATAAGERLADAASRGAADRTSDKG
ncbi:DUF3618 domain-containing protein [Falsirhodobacter halotolerans]|uniref:DUF3618 domain-containing protein n=1 Tax=Falsirhodobacter halotolerans TaxID=1146892 RepID=UPI001FD5ECB9|nr:DUF3618 domain-containing protein [Falsirhodobacter halotolerans]MCJ8139186.1 DUF3618 domain-containing protein [Falsirhodobacter halotolerans]